MVGLNEQYISVIRQIRKLNAERFTIYEKFKVKNEQTKLKCMITPSIYHDLYGNDLDKMVM